MIKAVIFDMFETLITHYNSPLYFGTEMAMDAKIPKEQFLALWRPTEQDRTIGKLTLEATLEMILREQQCYTEELVRRMVAKRVETKEDCFKRLHTEIVPMLEALKQQGLLIGLISNCFSEEAEVIRKSQLFPYFDAVYLSYEQGIQKPDKEIFNRCLENLNVQGRECIYIGDGGSKELETARSLGMCAMQAVWYFQEGTMQPFKRKQDFIQVEKPLDVLKYV